MANVPPFFLSPVLPRSRALFLPLSLSLLLTIAGCANPVPPSGGPRDTTPPAIAQSRPENGAVNVERASVSITFSEYVERRAFTEALSVTPRFAQPLEFDWSGREVTISFPEPLRDNTTYILTLDTNLSDVRGVTLNRPVQVAFSTGPTINRGAIAGVVRTAPAGQIAEGVDVYAYLLPDTTDGAALPDSLPPRPAYRTQTGEDGRFAFEYLREQPYYVIALRDNNRDRRPNDGEPFALPPNPTLRADSTGAEPEEPWIMTALDTIPPQVIRAQPRSEERLRLQLSEPVHLTDRSPTRWTLRDSARQRPVDVTAVYQPADAPNAVFLHTAPQRPAPHLLSIADGALADTSGNMLRADTVRFTPTDTPDTLSTRLLTFLPANLAPDTLGIYTLWPRERPGIRLNAPLDSARLRSSLTVADTAGPPRDYTLRTSDGTTLRLDLDPPLQPDAPIRIGLQAGALANVDSLTERTYRRISDRQLGTLSGFVSTSDSTAAPIVVEVYRTGAGRFEVQQTTADATGQFSFSALPEGTYRFRAFLDRNGNGRWDGGQLLPYRPPEPLTWSAGTIDNRPRWDNVLDDTLRVPPLGS